MAKLVYGVGINDRSRPSRVNKIILKEYKKWSSMLERCYSEKMKLKCPTYEKCHASDNFKNYQYFYEWCQNQTGFKNEGWELDKDLLIKGNKTYSEDKCIFLPKEINSLLTKSDKARGLHPIGVVFHKLTGRFASEVKINGRKVHLGLFDCPIQAFNEYKKEKEWYIKILAEKYRFLIDSRAYKALINYKVDIND